MLRQSLSVRGPRVGTHNMRVCVSRAARRSALRGCFPETPSAPGNQPGNRAFPGAARRSVLRRRALADDDDDCTICGEPLAQLARDGKLLGEACRKPAREHAHSLVVAVYPVADVRRRRVRREVSVREFYAHRLNVRELLDGLGAVRLDAEGRVRLDDALHRWGRLFQEYACMALAKTEMHNLRWYENNQAKIRADLLSLGSEKRPVAWARPHPTNAVRLEKHANLQSD